MKKRIVALLLTLVMVISVMPLNVFAEELDAQEETQKPLIYVSLGDSMTNGYGLDGYQWDWQKTHDYLVKVAEHITALGRADIADVVNIWATYPNINNTNGLLQEAPNAYPSQFRAHLETVLGREVDLVQLGMSGSRINEIWFALSQATDGEKAYPGDDYLQGSGYFTSNYYFMLNHMEEITGEALNLPEKIDWEALDFADATTYDELFNQWQEVNQPINIANRVSELYVKSVKAADIISLNAGINNFGVYILNFIENTFNVEFDGSSADMKYDFKSDLNTILPYATEEEKELIEEYSAKINAMVEDMLAEMQPDSELEQYMRDFTRHMTYTYACFCVGYARTLECIAELNDDVTIVMMNMINYLADLKISTPYGLLDYGKIFGLTMDSANAYAANVAAKLNADESYGPTILYADAGNDVELLMNELVETNGDFTGYDITRQRLLETYLFNIGKEGLFTMPDVIAYEAALAALESGDGSAMSEFMKEKDTFAAGIEGWYTWIDTCKNQLALCKEWRTYPWEDLAGPFKVSTEAEVKAYIDTVEAQFETYLEEAYIGLEADLAKADAAQAETLKLYSGYLGFEKGMIEALKRQDLNIELFAAMEQSGTTSILGQMFAEAQTNSESLGAGYADKVALLDDIKNADAVAAGLAFGDALAATISGNELYTSMLYLLAYFKVGSGVMCHPSNEGHAQMAHAINTAWDNKTTPNVDDFVNNRKDEYTQATLELMREFYDFLANNDSVTTPEKVDLLEKIYSIVENNGILANYSEVMAAAQVYRALTNKGLITDDQTLAIILEVYGALLDGTVSNAEIRAIADYIYFDVLAVPAKAYTQRSAQPEMTAALKLEIIVTVYEVLKDNNVLPVSPELAAIEKLYTDLTKEELLNPEQILGLFDIVVKTVVENETLTDEVIAGATTKITETILNDPSIPAENKLAIVQKVTEALGNTNMSGAGAIPTIPYLDVIQDLQMNLKNAGYLSDEQATQIINYLYEKLTSGEELDEKDLVDVAKVVYNVVFDRDELTTADKLEIVAIIYTTLEAHGIITEENVREAMAKAVELVKENYNEIYEDVYAFAAANGYIVMAQNGIDMAIAAIESIDLTGTEITAEAQAAIETELAAVVATLEEIKIALGNATTVDALVDAVFALEGDMWAHLNNLEQLALQAGADVYELVYLPNKDLIEKINGAVEATIAAVKDYVAHIITGEVEMSDEFFYLAITDGNDGYADLVAESLGLTAEQYKKVTMEEVTAADIAAADFITVAYSGVSALEFAVEQLLGEANGYVQYVDEFVYAVDSKLEAGLPILNTAGIDIYSTVMEVVEAEAGEYLALVEGKEVAELNWAGLVGAENVAYVEAALAELRAALIEAGVTETIAIEIDVVEEAAKLIKENVQGILLDTQLMYEVLGEHAIFTLEIPVADLAVFAAESAMYEFISYNKEYADTMMAITAINPEATVAALGNYNRFDVDYTFVTEEISFTLAEILAEVEFEFECEMPELPACVEPMLIDAITKYGQQLDTLINAALNAEIVIPSEEIEANDVLAVIADFTSAHPFAYAVANYNVYFVNICDAREGGDAYIAMQIMNGLTVNMPCIHVYDDCADEYCNICGEKRVAPGHKFEDGVCTVCGAKDPNYKPDEPILPPVHVHVVAIIPATEPTCTETGLTAGTVCATCGMILAPQRVIPALGHTEEIIPAVEATCSATGLTEGKKCSVCGEILVKQEEVAKLEHTFESVVTEPTCDATGYTTHTCTVCGYSYKDSTTAKRAHKWDAGVIVKEPTCTRPGSMQVSCSYDDCDAFYFDNLVPALGHTEETIPAVAATCTETGLTEGKKCSVCGEILVAQEEIAAKGHSFGEWTVTKEATRKEAGEETRSCACGETETREIPALGGANVGAIVGGGIGGAGVLAVGVYFFLKKKKLF